MTLTDNPFLVHCYVREDLLCGVVVADREYPARVAYALISKAMKEFEDLTGDAWKRVDGDEQNTPVFMQDDLVRFQDPRQVDKITDVQANLDEVKEVMQNNMRDILQRGETLESLMGKSKDLSAISIQFHDRAKKQNQCCKAY